jgi:hypothetical protein
MATFTPVDRPDLEAVCSWLYHHYGQNTGWIECFWKDGNPQDELTLSGRIWLRYDPATFDEVVDTYSDLVACYGNVYLSIGLYHEQRRAFDAVSYLPGLFVDDYTGGAALPASALLVTSQPLCGGQPG